MSTTFLCHRLPSVLQQATGWRRQHSILHDQLPHLLRYDLRTCCTITCTYISSHQTLRALFLFGLPAHHVGCGDRGQARGAQRLSGSASTVSAAARQAAGGGDQGAVAPCSRALTPSGAWRVQVRRRNLEIRSFQLIKGGLASGDKGRRLGLQKFLVCQGALAPPSSLRTKLSLSLWRCIALLRLRVVLVIHTSAPAAAGRRSPRRQRGLVPTFVVLHSSLPSLLPPVFAVS